MNSDREYRESQLAAAEIGAAKIAKMVHVDDWTWRFKVSANNAFFVSGGCLIGIKGDGARCLNWGIFFLVLAAVMFVGARISTWRFNRRVSRYLGIVCAASLLLACIGCESKPDPSKASEVWSTVDRPTAAEFKGLTAVVASLQDRVKALEDRNREPTKVLPEPCVEDAYVIKGTKP